MFKKINNINWQYFFLILLSSLIPTGINLLPFIALWAFFWVYTGEYKRFKLPRTMDWFWIFSLFFLLNLIGIFYSENITRAMSLTQAKIVFLLVPVLISNYTVKRNELREILLVFCFSNLFISFYLICRAFFFALALPDPIYTYSNFSIFTHPSYASLYMAFSIAALFLAGFNLSAVQRNDFLVKVFMAFILVIGVLFCSSKIGFITLTLTLLYLVIYFIIKTRLIRYAIVFSILLLCTFFIFIKAVPGPMGRLANVILVYKNINDVNLNNIENIKTRTSAKGMNQRESTLARIFIWNSSIEVMRKNLFFGVGTGDVNDELLTSFENNHLYSFLNGNLNAHNQYIETELAIGLPGLFILAFLTIGVFIYGFFKKNILLCVFLALFILNFFVESMLNVLGPCLFFSLFFFLLVKVNLSENYEVACSANSKVGGRAKTKLRANMLNANRQGK
jgi:O-antigen ligase